MVKIYVQSPYLHLSFNGSKTYTEWLNIYDREETKIKEIGEWIRANVGRNFIEDPWYNCFILEEEDAALCRLKFDDYITIEEPNDLQDMA